VPKLLSQLDNGVESCAGLDIITRVPVPDEGGAGALAPTLLDGPSNTQPPPPNIIELKLHF
jgi:hypothetical protein